MCANCNCPDPIYDNCVFYTGVDIPSLCIKNGDSLAKVESQIFAALQLLSTGEGVNLPDIIIDNTTLLELLDGKELNVSNILQALITYSEQLDSRVTVLESKTDTPITINAPCLSLPSNPTKDDILKATAEKVCQINTSVSTVTSDYVKATDLCDMVAQCLEEINSNPTTPETVVQEYTHMPKYVALPYLGPLSVFDSTGKGIASQGYDKVYICNGNNGTKDLRGFTLIGANTNVSGGTLNPVVDPTLPANAGYSIAPGSIKGAFTHALSANENGNHNHQATDNGHFHLSMGVGSSTDLTSTNTVLKEKAYGGNPSYDIAGTNNSPSLGKTSVANSGITIASSGLGSAHNNTQPSFGVVYIIYIP